MGILASCLIKAIIASGILYGYYLAALKNKKFHAYNRFYLLLSVLVSLTVPFIDLRWLYIEGSENAPLAGLVNTINSPVTSRPANYFTTGAVLAGVSACISVWLLVSLASKINWIYRMKRTHPNTRLQGFTLVETELKQAPFSFLGNLFWKRGLSAADTSGKRILMHELAHIRQKHTYDKLLMQVVCCLLWMNPFYWLMHRELNTIHEFIADAAAVEDGDTESFARMLLYSHQEGRYLSPAHSFFNSSIKRRLIMISLSNKTRYSYVRRVLVLPVALLVLAVLTVSTKAQTGFQTVKAVQQPVSDTVPKAPVKKHSSAITLTEKKPEKKPALEPVTVTGKKSGKQPAAEPVTVKGRKSKKRLALTEVIVTGKKAEKKP